MDSPRTSHRLVRSACALALVAMVGACAATSQPTRSRRAAPAASSTTGRASAVEATRSASEAWLGYGTITGVVTDGDRAPVADATVRLGSSGYEADTDAYGGFTITDVLPGPYPLTSVTPGRTKVPST